MPPAPRLEAHHKGHFSNKRRCPAGQDVRRACVPVGSRHVRERRREHAGEFRVPETWRAYRGELGWLGTWRAYRGELGWLGKLACVPRRVGVARNLASVLRRVAEPWMAVRVIMPKSLRDAAIIHDLYGNIRDQRPNPPPHRNYPPGTRRFSVIFPVPMPGYGNPPPSTPQSSTTPEVSPHRQTAIATPTFDESAVPAGLSAGGFAHSSGGRGLPAPAAPFPRARALRDR